MRFIGKKTKIISCILILIIIISFVLIRFSLNAFLDFMTPESLKQLNYTRAKLLYHTDHEELLKKCREKILKYNESLSDDREDNEVPQLIDQPPSGVSQEDSNSIEGLMPGLPPTDGPTKRTYMRILDLKPRKVYISPKSITLCFGPTFYSVSVTAFAQGDEGYDDLELTDGFKLIDGLWYSDDGFHKHTNFSDYLEKLKECDLEDLKR